MVCPDWQRSAWEMLSNLPSVEFDPLVIIVWTVCSADQDDWNLVVRLSHSVFYIKCWELIFSLVDIRMFFFIVKKSMWMDSDMQNWKDSLFQMSVNVTFWPVQVPWYFLVKCNVELIALIFYWSVWLLHFVNV